RSASLHSRPNHLMGHSTNSVSQDFRPERCSSKFQECVPGFSNAQAQTIEGGCRGKCLPASDGSTVPVSLSKHSVPCSHFSRNWGPSYRTRTGTTSTPDPEQLGPPPRRGCWTHGNLCRRTRYYQRCGRCYHTSRSPSWTLTGFSKYGNTCRS